MITGAASGIGAATATRFASEGATVIGLDVRAGGAVHYCDVADERLVEAVLSDIVDEHGRIDTLVACAGVEHQAVVTDTPLEEWERVIRVNLTGVFLCAKHAIPHMPAGGSVVIIASISGIVATDGEAAYCASKAGAIGLARALAVDYAASGIRTNAICPGVIDTPMNEEFWRLRGRDEVAKMHPLGRFGRAEEVASVAVFLASEESSFVTGAVWTVDGGFSAT